MMAALILIASLYGIPAHAGEPDSQPELQKASQYADGTSNQVAYYLLHNGNTLPGSGSNREREKWAVLYEDLTRGIGGLEKVEEKQRVELARQISQMTDTNARPAEDAYLLARTIKDNLPTLKGEDFEQIKVYLDKTSKAMEDIRQAGGKDGSWNRFLSQYGREASRGKIAVDEKTGEPYVELATKDGAWQYHPPLARKDGYNGHYVWHRQADGKWEPRSFAWNKGSGRFEPLLKRHTITAKLPQVKVGKPRASAVVAAKPKDNPAPLNASPRTLAIVNHMGDTETPYYVEKRQYYWQGKTLRDSDGNAVGYKIFNSDPKNKDLNRVFYFYGKERPDAKGAAPERGSRALYIAQDDKDHYAGHSRNLRILDWDELKWNRELAKKAVRTSSLSSLTKEQREHVRGADKLSPGTQVVRTDLAAVLETQKLEQGGKRKVLPTARASEYMDWEGRRFKLINGKLVNMGISSQDDVGLGSGHG